MLLVHLCLRYLILVTKDKASSLNANYFQLLYCIQFELHNSPIKCNINKTIHQVTSLPANESNDRHFSENYSYNQVLAGINNHWLQIFNYVYVLKSWNTTLTEETHGGKAQTRCILTKKQMYKLHMVNRLNIEDTG